MIVHLHLRRKDGPLIADCDGKLVTELPAGDRIMIGAATSWKGDADDICGECLRLSAGVPESEHAK